MIKNDKSQSRALKADAKYRIAIAGNPNVGKSTVFNALTGMHQHTGNWPGKTVEYAEGICSIGDEICTVVDIPGTYSLLAHSPEEEVARDILLDEKTDAVVIVCDATCLERNLVLAMQILDLGKPALLCINLLDEAERKGIEIDRDLLSKRLNLPVVGAVARKKGGLKELTDSTSRLLKCIDSNKEPLHRPLSAEKSAEAYVREAEEICRGAYSVNRSISDRKDRTLDYPFTGKKTAYPIMIALLMVVFWITITGANYPSEWLFSLFSYVGRLLHRLFDVLCAPAWLRGLLLDGAYSTLIWIISVMLPPMAIFFPLFTFLEDVGYLPRVAFNLDKSFHKCNTCGKQALTMCMGFGCNAAGVIGCRIIDSPREHLIAVLTNSLVPCNGRFPILITIITIFFVGSMPASIASLFLTAFILLSVMMTLFISKLLSATVLRGVSSAFTLELPPYRRPQIGKILIRSLLDRTVFVLGRAVIAAIPAGILIWLMANLSFNGSTLLAICSNFLDPFARLLGLDGIILMAFILGIPANEIVIPIAVMAYMAGNSLTSGISLIQLRELLTANGWTATTAICTLLFTLFHWPCATTLMTVKKETGSIKWTIAAALIPTLCGMLCCLLVNLLSLILA